MKGMGIGVELKTIRCELEGGLGNVLYVKLSEI